jgi:hypothetical protein
MTTLVFGHDVNVLVISDTLYPSDTDLDLQ